MSFEFSRYVGSGLWECFEPMLKPMGAFLGIISGIICVVAFNWFSFICAVIYIPLFIVKPVYKFRKEFYSKRGKKK